MGKVLQMAPREEKSAWAQGYDAGYADGYQAGLTARQQAPKSADESERGREAKRCLDHYYTRYKEIHGVAPSIYGKRDMGILMRLLKTYDEEAVLETLDTFLAYDKRADYTLPRFQSRFDVLYLRNKRLAEGR